MAESLWAWFKWQAYLVYRRWQVVLGPHNDEFWYFIDHGRLREEDERRRRQP